MEFMGIEGAYRLEFCSLGFEFRGAVVSRDSAGIVGAF